MMFFCTDKPTQKEQILFLPDSKEKFFMIVDKKKNRSVYSFEFNDLISALYTLSSKESLFYLMRKFFDENYDKVDTESVAKIERFFVSNAGWETFKTKLQEAVQSKTEIHYSLFICDSKLQCETIIRIIDEEKAKQQDEKNNEKNNIQDTLPYIFKFSKSGFVNEFTVQKQELYKKIKERPGDVFYASINDKDCLVIVEKEIPFELDMEFMRYLYNFYSAAFFLHFSDCPDSDKAKRFLIFLYQHILDT